MNKKYDAVIDEWIKENKEEIISEWIRLCKYSEETLSPRTKNKKNLLKHNEKQPKKALIIS